MPIIRHENQPNVAEQDVSEESALNLNTGRSRIAETVNLRNLAKEELMIEILDIDSD